MAEKSLGKRPYSSSCSNTTFSGHAIGNSPPLSDRLKRPPNVNNYVGGVRRPAPFGDFTQPVNTCFRVLFPEPRVPAVVGKGGAAVTALAQEMGAWITVHQFVPGDEERVIEITDVRNREPDGGISPYSPAREALLAIHERILSCDGNPVGPGDGGRTVTRLIVPRSHVGCLLGKGGKIVEQMRQETNTQIRVLPRDYHLPRCVLPTDELVQVGGNPNGVKKAIAIISSHLKKNPFRDRSAFHGTKPTSVQAPQNGSAVGMNSGSIQVPLNGHAVEMNLGSAQASLDGSVAGTNFGSMQVPTNGPSTGMDIDLIQVSINGSSVGMISGSMQESLEGMNSGSIQGSLDRSTRGMNYGSIQVPLNENFSGVKNFGDGKNVTDFNDIVDQFEPFPKREIILRILCPCDKIARFIDKEHGLIDLLRFEVGVNVDVADPIQGYDEQIITITSQEEREDVLFPAQEALLHIQTHIVDLVPNEKNIVKTRLLIPSSQVEYLGEKDVFLTEIHRSSKSEIQIIPRDERPIFMHSSEELVQIVGEMSSARQALLQLTERLRGYFFDGNLCSKDPSYIPRDGQFGRMGGTKSNSSTQSTFPADGTKEAKPIKKSVENLQDATISWPLRDVRGDEYRTMVPEVSRHHEVLFPSEVPSTVPTPPERFPVARVSNARTTMEFVLSEYVADALTRCTNKLMKISEMSGAKVELVRNINGPIEDMIKISGTLENAKKAQNMLQGFILSINQDDTTS